jgi:hypothetical protein
MKTPLLACRLGMVVAILLLGDSAFGQGCNLAVVPADDPPDCDGVPIAEAYCEGPGTLGYYSIRAMGCALKLGMSLPPPTSATILAVTHQLAVTDS